MKTKTIVIAAGGTGGHIFPALSVAQALKKGQTPVSLLWIGTYRSREVELCKKNNIPIMILDVIGLKRRVSFQAVVAAVTFVRAIVGVMCQFTKHRPEAVIAFGGYVCAPVLAAAVVKKIPIYLQEQNTVAGMVNRFFSRYAKRVFLGFPLAGKVQSLQRSEVTGTPVRTQVQSFDGFPYPKALDRSRKSILICGGSQGAQSMNESLVESVAQWSSQGMQIIWQTGTASYKTVESRFKTDKNVLVFETLDDLYPYYAVSKIIIGRAGASTLAEIAYFGLPCIVIPLPWAAENHQWVNAGLVQMLGWGIRIKQDAATGKNISAAVAVLLSDDHKYNAMCMKALDNSPAEAADKIVSAIKKDLKL